MGREGGSHVKIIGNRGFHLYVIEQILSHFKTTGERGFLLSAVEERRPHFKVIR